MCCNKARKHGKDARWMGLRQRTTRDEMRQGSGQPTPFTGAHFPPPRTGNRIFYNRMTHYFHFTKGPSTDRHHPESKRTRSTTWAGTLRTRDGTYSSSHLPLSSPKSCHCHPPSLGAKDARRVLRDIRFAVTAPLAHDLLVYTIMIVTPHPIWFVL